MQKKRNHQQGVVIIMALFIVALVAALAVTMMARMSRDTERTHLILRDAEAMRYTAGSVAWAKGQLAQNWKVHKKNKLVDVMPLHLPKSKQNGFVIESALFDMQGRFNLNQVLHPQQMENFENLIMAVYPQLGRDEAQSLVASVLEWITPGRRDGGINQYYLKLLSPYRAAHREMLIISEFRLIKGVSQQVYLALKPYLTALPAATPLNIQTASAPVLMTLHRLITREKAAEIIAYRNKKPFVSVDQFLSLPQIKTQGVTLGDVKLTTTSDYFLLKTSISVENQTWVIYTLLHREPMGQQAKVRIVWQTRGNF